MSGSSKVWAALGLIAACAALPAGAQEPAAAEVEPPPPAQSAGLRDPWEPFNRSMFAVNEALDRALLEPIGRGYRAVTPGFVRIGVRNVLANLRSPVIFANDVLQGELARAGTTAGRFGLNTTVGVLGLVDVASDAGLPSHDEDFGQTLAVWGVPSGPYLFVPLRGPSTVRDALGWGVDAGLDPGTYGQGDQFDTFRISRATLTAVSARESLLEVVDGVRSTSPDPYLTYRVTYELTRESAIANETGGENEPPPDFGPAE